MKVSLATVFVAAVAISHVIIGVMLYRQRLVDGGNAVWDSDFAIFLFPMLVAIAVNAFIIGAAMPAKWKPAARYATACALAILVGFVSEYFYFFVALNTYGT
jgi:hypothetical protein